LTVTVTDAADSTNTITTGHDDTSVTDTDGGDAHRGGWRPRWTPAS